MDLKEKALNITKKRHPWELARVKVISNFLATILPASCTEFRVFDIGSGDTFVIQELSKKFKNISFFAVDTNYEETYIEAENSKYKEQKVPIQLFKSIELAEASCSSMVNLVLLLDVIEHIENDVAFLKKLASSTKVNSETRFIITVPAFQFLFCSHDVFLEHYRRYNNKTLKRTIYSVGLQTERIGYFFIFPLVLRFIRVMYEKKFPIKKANGIGNWEGGRIITSLLYWILVADFKLSTFLNRMHIRLPGLSNFAVCKKSA